MVATEDYEICLVLNPKINSNQRLKELEYCIDTALVANYLGYCICDEFSTLGFGQISLYCYLESTTKERAEKMIAQVISDNFPTTKVDFMEAIRF